jgi:short-subunit dehydrogenase
MTTTTSDGYIIITGASQGIGACFAEALAKRGKNLILVARSLTKVEALAASLRDKYRVRVEVLVKDLALAPSAAEVAAHCAEFSVDGLINNAGFGLGDQFAREPLDRVIAMLNVNIVTLTALTHLLIPSLRKSRGVIINLASTAAFQPVPYMAAYAASKAYVLHWSEPLHAELHADGIYVLTLCPGATTTGFFDAAGIDAARLWFPVQTPEAAVQTALRAWDSGRALAISGWKNRLLVLGRFAPHWILLRMSTAMMGH